MPLVLSDHNIKDKSDEEILEIVVKTYADPANWEVYEKDIGNGRFIERQPWGKRDKGEYARIALEYIKQRREK